MASKKETNITGDVSILSSGVKLEGKLYSEGNVRIDGSVNGEVTVNGNLTLGESSTFVGDVKANNITLSGIMEGKVIAAEKLILENRSKLKGELKSLLSDKDLSKEEQQVLLDQFLDEKFTDKERQKLLELRNERQELVKMPQNTTLKLMEALMAGGSKASPAEKAALQVITKTPGGKLSAILESLSQFNEVALPEYQKRVDEYLPEENRDVRKEFVEECKNLNPRPSNFVKPVNTTERIPILIPTANVSVAINRRI